MNNTNTPTLQEFEEFLYDFYVSLCEYYLQQNGEQWNEE